MTIGKERRTLNVINLPEPPSIRTHPHDMLTADDDDEDEDCISSSLAMASHSTRCHGTTLPLLLHLLKIFWHFSWRAQAARVGKSE